MTNSNTLKESIDALGYAFHEFKATNDQRLNCLEAKENVDPLLLDKMDRLNGAIDKAHEQVLRSAASSQRPVVKGSTAHTDNQEHKEAFLDYVRKGNSKNLESFEQKSLNTESDAEGGFLVPSIISDHVHSLLKDTSSLRSLARVTNITTSALEMLLDKNDTPVGWVGEREERPETDATEVAKIRIPVHELYANPRATQKLLDDSAISVEQWLSEKIAQNMSSHENASFILGDGRKKPTGFLHYGLTPMGTNEWGKLESVKTGIAGAFKTENPEQDLIDLFHTLKPAYLSKAVWLMSRSAQNQVRKLKDPSNGHYLWQPSLALETTPTLMGYPVHVMDDMPGLVAGTNNQSIAFGNFLEGYQIVDRQGIHILRDPYSHKPYIEFYATRRVGGDVINFEALKVLDFSNQ